MKVSGSATLNAPRDEVWKALNDPAVLVRTIPGCQRLEETGPDAYRMTITAGVASIKGVYTGEVSLSEQKPGDSFVLKAAGAGAPGTVSADVVVTLSEAGPATTTLTYDADAIVGGMIGGVGQRMLSGVAKKTAGEFFRAVDDVLCGNVAAEPQRGPADADVSAMPGVYYEAPGASAALSGVGGTDFAKGAVVGAVAAIIGALVGGLLAGRQALTMSLSCYSTAREAVAAVKAKEVSARELLDLQVERIELVNPTINAIVSLDIGRARDQAAELDEQTARGDDVGALHGLPFAFKDTHETAGWPTTFGSPLRADYVPTRDDLVVERIRAAGVTVLGKTNVPEWAAGSHTFNPIFGVTRNPYDVTRSAGGSSGGAAAALASGMVPLADGSDMGGSLRNPASFCNVVGLRPSVGRVPAWPSTNAWQLLGVSGPMARNVEDLALLLSVVAGPSSRAPLSLETPGVAFADPLRPGALAGARVALSVDLGGAIEVDRDVAAVIEAAGSVLSEAGASVESAYPSLAGADEAFTTLRAWAFYDTFAKLLAEQPNQFKESLADNIRQGAELTGQDVASAYRRMTMVAERVRRFFESYDVLALPVSQVPPFSVDDEYPHAINGKPQQTYLDWMRAAYLITVTGCPAISMPAGFTQQGWPVGIQLVTAPRTERRLLEIAFAFEQATSFADRHPDLGGTP